MPLKVFVSYAKEDRDRALHCYDLLARTGASPWLDEKNLLPGQNWEFEIERAFNEANLIVLLLSKASISKRGFVRREANDAIAKLQYKQPDDIYVLPLLLEPCDVPEQVTRRLQYIDLHAPGAWDRVRAALALAAQQQSIDLSHGLAAGPFRVFTETRQERRVGRPGYDISIEYPRFESHSERRGADELNAYFAGRAAQVLIESRQKPWMQMPDLFKADDEFRNMDGRWDKFDITLATDRLISIVYHVSWYGAGAAHPNSHYETFSFCSIDGLHRLDLHDFFTNSTEALKSISEHCVAGLCKQYWQSCGEQADQGQVKWFKSGAGEDFDNFTAFTVGSDHFTFIFAPYQVSSFAAGTGRVEVPFYDLRQFLRPDGPHLYAHAGSGPDC